MKYIILDTETTGIEFGSEIVELAYMEVCPNTLEILSEFEQRYFPRGSISPAASAAHGLVKEDLEGCPPTSSIERREDPIVLCCHNLSFDKRMIEPYWKNIVDGLCTVRAAQQLFPESPDHKLQTLKYHLKLRRDQDAHSAKGDIMVLYELVRYMLEATQLSLRGFIQECNKPVVYETMWFGMHKGKTLNQIPLRYRQWLATLRDDWGDLTLFLNGGGE